MNNSTYGKWHITPSGEVKKCVARDGNCPYGKYGHFDTKEQAEEKFRELNEPSVKHMSKSTALSPDEIRIRELQRTVEKQVNDRLTSLRQLQNSVDDNDGRVKEGTISGVKTFTLNNYPFKCLITRTDFKILKDGKLNDLAGNVAMRVHNDPSFWAERKSSDDEYGHEGNGVSSSDSKSLTICSSYFDLGDNLGGWIC